MQNSKVLMEQKTMKRLLTIILLLFLSLQLFALGSSIAVGYQEKYTISHAHDPIYISIDVWQDIYGLRIYGNYTDEMKRSDYVKWQFYPSQDYFTVGARYKLDCFEIELEHQCYHPVVAYNQNTGINGSYTKVEFKLSSKEE